MKLQILIWLFICSLAFNITSCTKGYVLKIGDQDIFAFGSVEGCNFVLSAQGARVSWKSSVPVHFIISSSVPTEYDKSIINAANTWNSLKRMTLIEVHRDNNYPATPSDDGTNGIYFMSSWDSDQTKEQARTAINWDISKIRDADIKINAANFKFFIEGQANTTGKISIESLVLHEFGHALGLRHIEDPKSSMQALLPANTSRLLPGDVDINSLNCEY